MKQCQRIVYLQVVGILVLVNATACSPPPETTPEPLIPSATATQESTSTLTPYPTRTNTLEPTSLPGIVSIPLDSMDYGIPWLPLDRSKALMSSFYAFNFNNLPFGNVYVRQAFAAAVDREQIAAEATGFHFRNVIPATTLTPADVLGRDLYGVIGIPFNPTRAKELLVEAGYSSVEDFPPVTLVVYMRGEAAPGAYYHMAQSIVGMWESNLGITADIVVLSKPQDYVELFKETPPDIIQLVWGADYCDPDNFLNTLFHSTSEFNYGNFANAEYDRLVDEAAGMLDPAHRQPLYIQAEQILTEQLTAVIPLYYSSYYTP